MDPRFRGDDGICHSRASGNPDFFMHGGEPKDHEVFARNDTSCFLGAAGGPSDCFQEGRRGVLTFNLD